MGVLDQLKRKVSSYHTWPEVMRNYEDYILHDLKKGFDVTIEYREPFRVGPFMVDRKFLGSMSRTNPKRKRKEEKK